MSAGVTLRTPSGGSVTLKANDEITSDEIFELSGFGVSGLESGDGVNGRWIKFPDGTLMCHGFIEYTGGTTRQAFEYPMHFVDTPSPTVSQVGRITSNLIVEWSATGIEPNESLTVVGTRNMNAYYIAMGRWK